MPKPVKIKRAQKNFLEAMKKKFSEDNSLSTPSFQEPVTETPMDDHITLITYHGDPEEQL